VNHPARIHAPLPTAAEEARGIEHRERARMLSEQAKDPAASKRRAAALRHMALLHMLACAKLRGC